MELFNWFKNFLAEHNNQIADFSSVIENKETLHNFSEAQQQLLTPLLEDGSNSFFAIWSIYPERELEQQPIVWIECESNPTAVCANNFREFLLILEYGGNLHRYFSKLDFYLLEGRVKESYLVGRKECADDALKIEEEYPEMKVFKANVAIHCKDLFGKTPVQIFLNAFDTNPNFDEWLYQ
ncbi:MAG: hypothetical protein FGM14_13630 [Flavobacteriales bacterium]|nr:hypothetical protein [Flavobacteriales bacterium]